MGLLGNGKKNIFWGKRVEETPSSGPPPTSSSCMHPIVSDRDSTNNHRVATFESIQNSPTFFWQNKFSLAISFIFQSVKNPTFNYYSWKFPHTPRIFKKWKHLTIVISRPWVYIWQADIYISTTQVESLLYNGSFDLKNNVMTKFPDNSLTWQNSLTWVKQSKFPDIFSKFPDFSLTWRIFCFSLKFPWHVATLSKIQEFQVWSLQVCLYTSQSFLLLCCFWEMC